MENREILLVLRLCIVTLLCIPETGWLEQAPLLAVNSLQGVFHSWGPRQCYCCRGETSTMVFLKALVPPLWLPRRCDVDSSWNNNVDGENQERGGGSSRGAQDHLLLTKLLKKHAVQIFTFPADRRFQCLHESLFYIQIWRNWTWNMFFPLIILLFL